MRRGVERGAGDRDVDRCFVEQGLERAERRAVEEQRDDREVLGAAALPLHGQRVLQFLADPRRAVRLRRDEHQHAGRAVDRGADRRFERVAAVEGARVDREGSVELGERDAQLADDGVVAAAVREEVGDRRGRHSAAGIVLCHRGSPIAALASVLQEENCMPDSRAALAVATARSAGGSAARSGNAGPHDHRAQAALRANRSPAAASGRTAHRGPRELAGGRHRRVSPSSFAQLLRQLGMFDEQAQQAQYRPRRLKPPLFPVAKRRHRGTDALGEGRLRQA